MEANPDYWGGKPLVDQVDVRPVTESSTRFAALASGQADVLWGVPLEMHSKVVKNPKVEVVSRPARRGMFLALTNKPGTPMADIRVRKAIAMAVNEDDIIEKIMRGQAIKSTQVPDPTCTGYDNTIKRYEYDLAEAKKLMKEAGYTKGFDIVVAGPTDRYVQDEKICEAVVKYLAKIGIRAKLDVKPKSIFFPELINGKYEMYFLGWLDGASDTGRIFSKLVHSYDEENGFGGWNGTRYSDSQLDKMIEENMSIVNMEERKSYLKKMNKTAMEEKVAMIPLHYQVDIYAIQKGKGITFVPRPDRWMVCKEMNIK
jgi:peptide/nickel transport system substrate-binding protein